MKKYNIRFLKQGLVEIECPDDMPIEEIITTGKETLDAMSDQDLVMAMSDVIPSGKDQTRFDADSFQVEAVEAVSDDYELLHATELWGEYIS